MCLPLLYNTDGDERGAKESNTYVKLAGNNLFHFYPSPIPTVPPLTSVTMYPYHPRRLAKSNIEKQYFSHRVNDVCNGSPSRIRRVLRISLGMTIRPRSSTRRTMPVAFILVPLLVVIPRASVCGNMGIMRRSRLNTGFPLYSPVIRRKGKLTMYRNKILLAIRFRKRYTEGERGDSCGK